LGEGDSTAEGARTSRRGEGGEGGGKLALFGQYTVARFSVQVVYNKILYGSNKVLHGSHLQNSYHKKRLAAVQTVSAKELVFMLQNCASECVNNRAYRTLQDTYD